MLSRDQFREVKEAERRRNLQNCRLGYVCNHGLLSSDELGDVRKLEWERNLKNCQTGYGFCDHTLLRSGLAVADAQKAPSTESPISPLQANTKPTASLAPPEQKVVGPPATPLRQTITPGTPEPSQSEIGRTGTPKKNQHHVAQPVKAAAAKELPLVLRPDRFASLTEFPSRRDLRLSAEQAGKQE
jgi:hypothetical protein